MNVADVGAAFTVIGSAGRDTITGGSRHRRGAGIDSLSGGNGTILAVLEMTPSTPGVVPTGLRLKQLLH